MHSCVFQSGMGTIENVCVLITFGFTYLVLGWAIGKLFDLFLNEPHIIEWSRYWCEKFNVEEYMPFLFIYVKMVVMHYHTI
jgi:hypothetical protein